MTNTNNKSSLREAFVQKAAEMVGTGIYVWGGNGELLDAMPDPIGWIERHEADAKNAARAVKLLERRRRDGIRDIRAFDCSGIVYWALKELGVLKNDVSSRGLYALCKPIDENALLPGDLVFHHDGKQIVHVGICVGDEQIECRGRDVGVVQNRRKPGYWNRFGRLPAMEESGISANVLIRGGSVRVREGDGIHSRCIGIVHRGERYPLLDKGPSGWYRIAWRGTQAYITNSARYTEVVYG